MLRFAELGFFLIPFGLYVAWRILGERTPPWALWAAIALTVAMGVGTVWFGVTSGLPPSQTYEPARMEDGVIVPGHGTAPHRR